MSIDLPKTPESGFQSHIEEGLIFKGEVGEVLDQIVTNWVGIGLFHSNQLDDITTELQLRGYEAVDHSGISTVRTRDKVRSGDLHRHGNGELIVHRTPTGKGSAHFYWPMVDAYDFPYEEDLVNREAHVDIGPEKVIVFPSQSWHQFDTDPNQDRRSLFTHYVLNVETPET